MLYTDGDTSKFLSAVRKLRERERKKNELARKAKDRLRELRQPVQTTK